MLDIKPCGCQWRWANNLMFDGVVCGKVGTLVYRCPKHTEEGLLKKEQQAKEEAKEQQYIRTNLTPLECDECSTAFGWVYANDLNGSKFYCNSCKEKFA